MKYTLLFTFIALLSSIATSQTTVSLTATRDVSIGYHDNYPTENTNYGNANHTSAFISDGFQGGINSGRGLLDFDLSSIPPGAVIIEAKLNLYAMIGINHPILGLGHIGNNATYLRRITSAWNESTVTWNNAPTFSTLNQLILPQSVTANQDYLGIDVTMLVQDMLDNPATSHGFALRLVDEQLPTKGLIFASLDQADHTKYPTLEITYCDLSLNTHELIEPNTLLAHPNPTSGMVVLNMKNITDDDFTLVIFDSKGQQIALSKVDQPLNEGNYQVDFTGYSNGVYFIKVISKSAMQHVKVIKR